MLHVKGLLWRALLFASLCVAAGGSELASAQHNGIIQSNINIVSSSQPWATVSSFSTKTSNNKLLALQVSAECGLYTATTTLSKKMQRSTSTASAAVYFRVLINGVKAQPDQVVFCSRMQKLSIVLQGAIDNCPVVDGVINTDDCEFTEEEVSLVLSTMDANSYGFTAPTVAGSANVEIQAKVISSTSVDGSGSAEAYGTIGNLSVIAQQMNLPGKR
jgi:hypothetical protein